MKPPVLFPYDTLPAEAKMAVRTLRLDGHNRTPLVKTDEFAVSLHEHEGKWQRAELGLEVSIPSGIVTEFEQSHGPLALVVVAHCLPTNGREQVRLARSTTDTGRWEGTFELDRDNYRGRVRLDGTVTATIDGVSHRPVAETNPWAVYVDAPETFRLGKALPVKWHDFTRDDAPLVAKAFKEGTHVIDFDRPLPTLFLNTAFAGLEGLLKDRKDRKGTERAIHDLLRTGIARSVWLALFRDSLSEVKEADEGAAVEWPETPWRAEVLRHILPEVMPGKSDAEMLRMVLTDWQEPQRAGELFARAEGVIGDVVKANEHLRRFVKKNSEEAIQQSEEGNS